MSIDFSDPYYFKTLYTNIRRILHFIGRAPTDSVSGAALREFTDDHDTIRKIVSWNFLIALHEPIAPEYEPSLFWGDWGLSYRITEQARAFAKLELNNISDLCKAILILLRADYAAQHQMGYERVSERTVGFYELVMLLNRTEDSILAALKLLESTGFVTLRLVFGEDGRVYEVLSEIDITPGGLQSLEQRGGHVTYNHISIKDSSGVVVAIQSTLSNIDAHVGDIKQKGNADIAQVLSTLTERIVASHLSESHKQEVLEQVEQLSDQAATDPAKRKPAIVKGSLAVLDKALGVAANLAVLWATFGPQIRAFFNI